MSMLNKFYKWVSCKCNTQLREENNIPREQIAALKARHKLYVAKVASLTSKYHKLLSEVSELERTYEALIAKCDEIENNKK